MMTIKVNIFNRIIIIVLMVCLIAFSMIAIIGLFESSKVVDRIIKYTTNLNPYILAVILFLILIIALILLIFEFYIVRIKVGNVASDQSGKTMISVRNASRKITEKLTGIKGLIDPKVSIIPMRKGIIINCSSKLIKGVNVAEKTKEITDIASEFASETFGFRVVKSNYIAVGFIAPEILKLNEYYNIKRETERTIKV